ncbi:MAG: hopanoid biosynthesis-associated RND transporter HpnN [Betaproteobacteria bacterium]|nr:MAG: hopanoid biosynthesis-associated RND transporter HpnN [Betaproteobacteria bacterium]
MTTHIVAACARRPWLVIVVASVLAASAFTYNVAHIAIDTDSAKLIGEDLAWRKRERVFDAAFPQRADLIAVVVDGATPELAEEATKTLALRLSSQPGMYRAVWRPDGGPFFERAGLLFESTADVARTTQQLIAAQPLLGTLAADPTLRGLMDSLSLMLDGVEHDPAIVGQLAQPLTGLAEAFEAVVAEQVPAFSWHSLFTGSVPAPRELRRFILVQPVLDYSALRPGESASGTIRQAAHELAQVDPRIRIRLTGPVPLADEEFGTLAEGAALNASVMMVAIVVLLWIALRSLRLVAAILLSLAVGLIVTAAIGLLAFGAFNLISVAFAVLFVGLGVDFCIQFCVCYRAKRYATGGLYLALRDAGGEVGGALALAAASTAAGFYAFLPTEYRGVSELGAIAGTGMIVAFVASITLLPALIAVFRAPGEPAAVGYAALAPLDRLLVRHRRRILIFSGAIAAVSIALLPGLQFDFNPLHLRSVKVESVATLLDLMQDPNTAPNTIDVLTPSLADAAALARRLEQLPEVDHTITLASFVPEQQQEKLALIEDAALLLDPVLRPAASKPPPNDDETVRAMSHASELLERVAAAHPGLGVAAPAARLGRALRTLTQGEPRQRERVRTALIPGLVTTLGQLRSAMQASPVTLATLPDEIKRDWIASDGRARIEIFPKRDANDNQTLRRFVAAVTLLAPEATGAPVSIQESSRTIVRAFLQAGLWALLAIILLLALVLRRATDVILTLAPLMLSGLVTLGICVATGLPLNFENIIALPLLLGIGVAFNIYFVTAWRAGRGELLQSSLTRAVIFSALTTGTAFGSLWLSHHPGTSSMGKLLALSLACTLVSALLFLPALLGEPRARR